MLLILWNLFFIIITSLVIIKLYPCLLDSPWLTIGVTDQVTHPGKGLRFTGAGAEWNRHLTNLSATLNTQTQNVKKRVIYYSILLFPICKLYTPICKHMYI